MIRRLVLVSVLAGWLLAPLTAGAQAATDPVQAALDWMRTQQQPDGGFSNGFAPGSDPGATADAVLAIAAAGGNPSEWMSGGKNPLDALQAALGAGAVGGAGAVAKLALATKAAGLDVHSFGSVDLTARILEDYSAATGMFGSGPFDSALAIQALVAGSTDLPVGAIDGLLAKRLADGTFSFNGDLTPGAGDSNTTAVVVLALIAAGEPQAAAPSLETFRAVQNDDGGWTYQKPSAFGEATDANSTALVIQALRAAGEDLSEWNDPASALLTLQQPSGAFAFNAAAPADNLLATVQAIPALVRVSDGKAASTSSAPWTTIAVGAAVVGLLAILAAVVLRRRSA
jgi:hypothetical protein